MRCEWRGNARELENTIERALALSDVVELDIDDIPLQATGTAHTAEAGRAFGTRLEGDLTLRELEDLYIDEVLARTGGNKVQAARVLGIDRKTLYRRAERKSRAHPENTEKTT